MKKFVVILLVGVSLFGGEVVKLSQKYKSSKKCMTCHQHIVKDWKNSWHAKSHYKKDEYFGKSIDYIARKTRQAPDVIKVKCATCHNPRITVNEVSDDYEVVASLGLDEGSEVKQALEDDTIAEGINCLVCHNIDKIDTKAPAHVRGMDRVTWNKNGIMSGPFGDANSPYHKTQQRDFFTKDQNQLCFVCHANDHSYVDNTLQFTNMEKEYKGNQKCTECHMGPKVELYASTYRFNGDVKKRKIRHHKFIGGHKEELWKDALKLSLKQKNKKLFITIKNPQPHNIPSGFGGRELLVEVVYYKGTQKIDAKTISLTTHYKRKRGRKSIPHLAIKQTKNLSIPAKGSKTLKVSIPKETTNIKVTLYYRLVNDEIREILKLQEPIWKKKFFITTQEIK